MEAQPQYKNVSTADERDHDESSTEAGDSLIGEGEKQQWDSIDLENRHRGGRRTRVHMVGFLGRLRQYRWLIDTALLVVILGLVVLLRLEIGRRPEAAWQVGGDYTGAGPKFSTKIVKWDADESFTPTAPTDFFSNKTLARWNTMMPEGTGWGSPDQVFFTTTMTHQLHCIMMMGRIYSGLEGGIKDGLPKDYQSHFMHCIDYLRQATMCAGDVAMEAHKPSDAGDNGPLDGGWSGLHVCKDYSEVIRYLEGQIKDGVRTVLPIDD